MQGTINKMTLKTYLAVGELVQAAAHQMGVVGPVQFTVIQPRSLKQIRAWANVRRHNGSTIVTQPTATSVASVPFSQPEVATNV